MRRDGKQYVYGYVPIVVAKCGMMLKETGESACFAKRVAVARTRVCLVLRAYVG
jgi:hypothetical protein